MDLPSSANAPARSLITTLMADKTNNKSHYSRGVQDPGARSSRASDLIVEGPQYETGFESPFWCLEFGDESQIAAAFVDPRMKVTVLQGQHALVT